MLRAFLGLAVVAGCAPAAPRSAPAARVSAPAGQRSGPQSGFVRMGDGVRIHYLEAGPPDGPAILFIPGWMTPGWIWQEQLDHFGRTHRVVAIDPRSQGESSAATEGHHPLARAADIRRVVEELRLSPVVLIGATMAVAEIAAYVDQFGTDGVSAIVLVNGIAGREYDAATLQGLLSYAASFQIDRRAASERFVRGLFKTRRSEAYLARMLESSLRTPTSAAMALLIGSITADFRPALAKIDKPTLIVAARVDAWMPFYQDLRDRIRGARLEVWDGAGHALFVDDAPRFNALVEELLAAPPSPSP